MNFKKFISGVGALAIAASAFAGMAVTANAEVTAFSESYSSTSTTTGWSTSTAGRYDPVILNENDNYFLSVDQSKRSNNGANVTGNVVSGKAAAGDNFTMTFDLRLTASTQGPANNQGKTTFTIKDAANSNAILSLAASAGGSTTWEINGTNNTVTLPASTWCSYKVTVNDGKTFLTVTNKDTAATIFERAVISGGSTTGGLGNITLATSRYNANFAIDNIVVREVADGDLPTVKLYTVTTKYVNENGDTIRTSNTDSVEEGKPFTPEYAETFDDDNNRYTYKSGANAIESVSADSEITIVYSSVPLADHTVTVKTTGLESVLDAVTVKDNKSGSYAYPRYILSGTDLYQINKSRYDQGFVNTFNNVTEDIEVSEAYEVQTANVVYFAEAEDIATLTASSTNNNIPARCSSGNAAYASEDAVITNLPAGKYKIAIATFGNAGTKFTATIGSNTFDATTVGYFNEVMSDEFTITEATDVVIGAMGNGGSSPKVIDYIYIVKTGDVEQEPQGQVVITPTLEASQAYVNKDDETDCAVVGKINVNISGGSYVFNRNNISYNNAHPDVQTLSGESITDDDVKQMIVSANDILVYVVINGTTDVNELKNIQFN